MRQEDEELPDGQAPRQADVNGESEAMVTGDVGNSLMTDDVGDDDPRDRLDELRERIRSGDLSHRERDQLDQLVFVVVLADRRAAMAARDFPGEVAMQRALAAEAWARVGKQLRVMLSHVGGL